MSSSSRRSRSVRNRWIPTPYSSESVQRGSSIAAVVGDEDRIDFYEIQSLTSAKPRLGTLRISDMPRPNSPPNPHEEFPSRPQACSRIFSDIQTLFCESGPRSPFEETGCEILACCEFECSPSPSNPPAFGIELIDAESYQRLGMLGGHGSQIWRLCPMDFNSGSYPYIASAASDNQVHVWDVMRPRQKVCSFDLHRHAYSVTGAKSRSGARFVAAAGGSPYAVCLFDFETLQSVAEFQGHRRYVNGMAFSEKYEALFSGGRGGSLVVNDLTSHHQIMHLDLGGDVMTIRPCDDADVFFTLHQGGDVRAFDLRMLRDGRETHLFKITPHPGASGRGGCFGQIRRCSVSTSGAGIFISVCMNGTLGISTWDGTTGKFLLGPEEENAKTVFAEGARKDFRHGRGCVMVGHPSGDVCEDLSFSEATEERFLFLFEILDTYGKDVVGVRPIYGLTSADIWVFASLTV